MIALDAMSWSKLLLMSEEFDRASILSLLDRIRHFITPKVEKELMYFHSDNSWIWQKAIMMPLLDETFPNYIMQGFDDADASLLEYSELPDFIIITEDHPMLLLNVTRRNNIIQLADLFVFLLTNGIIDRSTYYDYVTWLRDNRNITKKKFKRIKDKTR